VDTTLSRWILGVLARARGRLLAFVEQHRRVDYLVGSMVARGRNPLCRLLGKPVAWLPSALRREFTMHGRVKLVYCYRDSRQSGPLKYDRETIVATCLRVATGEPGRYGKIDAWLKEALTRHPIRRQRAVIMGSADQGFGPWYECLCLHHEALPTTIDYNFIEFQDARIGFMKAPVAEDIAGRFDVALSISSFEHDGLGRYGDRVDPVGDLAAMRQMKRLLRPGGLMFLSVPLGKDKVVFNANRIYGRTRLPLLLEGWTVVDSCGFEDKLLDRDTKYGWNPATYVRTPSGRKRARIHAEYPEYGPVWVLRND
jgi:hypothetical protein